MTQPSFFTSRALRAGVLMLMFGAALAIRLYDLTDPPLDFHPTRQLLSAIKARGLYYETQPDGISTWKLETAIRQAKLKSDVEPVVFEQLVALTYRFTGEQLWIARVYSSLFWLAGGIFLFLLIRGLISFEGALLSTAYYLFLPYAITASRSFQPDPLMVMLILGFWWTFSRWVSLASAPTAGRGTWIRAVAAGLTGGLAIFVKFYAAFFVIGGALGLALVRMPLRNLLRRPQLWVIVLLGILPAGAYLVYGIFIAGIYGQQFSGRFLPALLLSPFNYLQWQTKASAAVGGVFIMLGLLGYLLVRSREVRILLTGLWGAYLVYGLFFNYHVATHDYYHVPLIPIVAVSLAPVGEWFFARLAESTSRPWMRSAAYLVLAYGLLAVAWDARNQLKSVDYRPDAVLWAEIGGQFAEDARIIALTQDYGSRLQYWGWRTAAVWPYVGDVNYVSARGGAFSFDEAFDEYASKRDYFLVTDLEELGRQPELGERLFASYPILAQGNDYLIFDLRNNLQ